MLKNEDFIQEFVEEARDHLENFERVMLTNLADISAEQINDAFRAVHSIKGTAGFFGLTGIVAIAHSMETMMDFVNRKQIPLTDTEIDLLLEAKDRLKVLVNDVKQSETYPIDDILVKLQVAEAGFAKQEANEVDPMGEPVSPDARQFFAIFDFNPQTLDKIAALRKFGHHIYGIEMALTDQYLASCDGLGAIIENFSSIANVIAMISPAGDPLKLGRSQSGPIEPSGGSDPGVKHP